MPLAAKSVVQTNEPLQGTLRTSTNDASRGPLESTPPESRSDQKMSTEVVAGLELVALNDGLDNVVSSTSRSFAAYRALESERPDALFCDPLAEYLAGEATLNKQRAQIAVGSNPGVRFAVRTKYFDDALMSAVRRIKGEAPDAKVQVVIFGCGMDARAWRLPDASEPSDSDSSDASKATLPAEALNGVTGLERPSDNRTDDSSDASVQPKERNDSVRADSPSAGTEVPGGDGSSESSRLAKGSGPSDAEGKSERTDENGPAAVETSADESPLVEAVFEGDRPDVIELKRRLLGELEGAGKLPPLRLTRRRVMLPVNLNEGTWQDLLVEQGFRTSEPSVWLFEGLVMYLDPDAVVGLLEGAAKLSASGSVLLVSGISDLAVTRGKQSPSAVRRSWTWGTRDPAAFFNAHGWHVQKVDDVTAGRYGRTLPSTVGREPNLTWYLTAVKA